jgi:hypothetical protein
MQEVHGMDLLDDCGDAAEAGVSVGSHCDGSAGFYDHALAGAQILSATNHTRQTLLARE